MIITDTLTRALIVVLICFTSYGYACVGSNDKPVAQDKFTVSMLIKSDLPYGECQSLTIPLKRAGKLFLMEVIIDDQEGNLIFDTGASGLVLNKTYFRKATMAGSTSGGGITGSTNSMSACVVKRVDVSGLFYDQVKADMADLRHIEDRRGVKILGLFGVDLMNHLEVVFDAQNNELRLNRLDDQGNCLDPEARAAKYDFRHELDTRFNVMTIHVKIGDKMLNFRLDTGAEINVLHYGLSKKVMNTVEITKRSDIGGVGSGTTKALYGVMKEFELGNCSFGSMEVAVINLAPMCEAYGCNIDGMLGYDFWQKGVFCINLKKREISFTIAKGERK